MKIVLFYVRSHYNEVVFDAGEVLSGNFINLNIFNNFEWKFCLHRKLEPWIDNQENRQHVTKAAADLCYAVSVIALLEVDLAGVRSFQFGQTHIQ